jgi:hypothetical protein
MPEETVPMSPRMYAERLNKVADILRAKAAEVAYDAKPPRIRSLHGRDERDDDDPDGLGEFIDDICQGYSPDQIRQIVLVLSDRLADQGEEAEDEEEDSAVKARNAKHREGLEIEPPIGKPVGGNYGTAKDNPDDLPEEQKAHVEGMRVPRDVLRKALQTAKDEAIAFSNRYGLDALRLETLPPYGEQRRQQTRPVPTSQKEDFYSRFPDARRIGVL